MFFSDSGDGATANKATSMTATTPVTTRKVDSSDHATSDPTTMSMAPVTTTSTGEMPYTKSTTQSDPAANTFESAGIPLNRYLLTARMTF